MRRFTVRGAGSAARARRRHHRVGPTFGSYEMQAKGISRSPNLSVDRRTSSDVSSLVPDSTGDLGELPYALPLISAGLLSSALVKCKKIMISGSACCIKGADNSLFSNSSLLGCN